jgi:hypothetical protein
MSKHVLLVGLAAIASVAQAASADYFLKIEGVAGEASSGPIYLKVASSGDLDGDGAPDTAIVRMTCAGGQPVSTHYQVTSPRDAASGLATGKRQHKPITIIKEWDAATPQLAKVKPSYNIKENKAARMSADAEGWKPIELANVSELCPASQSALTAGSASTSKTICLVYKPGHEGDGRYCSQSVPAPK